MDALLYCGIILILGFIRMGQTKDVSDTVGIVSTGVTTTVNCELPVGTNLALRREEGAYTIILEELGLI